MAKTGDVAMNRPRAALAALCALVAIAAAPAHRGWTLVATPNFTLMGEVPEARLRLIGARLESFRATLGWLHPGSGVSPRETAVYVFASTATGSLYTRGGRAADGGHLGANAPYDVNNYVAIAAPDDDPPLDLLYHSYAHQFLDDGFPRLPLLVEEGLAELYTGFRVIPEGTLIGLPNSGHVAWVREHGPAPLGQEMRLTPADLKVAPETARQSFVPDSWALMHYLLSGSGDRRAGVPGFLEELTHGTGPDSAAQHWLGTGLEELQELIRAYVQGSRFLSLRATDPSVHADPAAFRSRSMPHDEVIAALGDFVVHAGKEHDADAERYFAEALRLNPRQARAHAGLGYLRATRNRPEDALFALEKAIAIEPDAMSCYLLARTLVQMHAKDSPAATTPAWLARARTLLSQSSSLRPGFAAPYVLLGSTHTRPDGDAAAGIAALERARALLPARTDIAGSLVYLYLRAGDAARAHAMVDRVLAPSGDAETTKKARLSLANYEANLAAQKSVQYSREAQARAEQDSHRVPVDDPRYAQFIQTLREIYPTLTDPVYKAEILKQIEAYEHPPDIDDLTVTETYNDAIDHANRRDYSKAIALLEDLLKHDLDPDDATLVKDTIQRLRKDQAKHSGPLPQ